MDVISACFVQGEGKRGSLQNNVNLQGSQSFHLGSISKSIFCLAGQKTWLDYSPGGLGLGLHAPEISHGIPKKPPERTALQYVKGKKRGWLNLNTPESSRRTTFGGPQPLAVPDKFIWMRRNPPACLTWWTYETILLLELSYYYCSLCFTEKGKIQTLNRCCFLLKKEKGHAHQQAHGNCGTATVRRAESHLAAEVRWGCWVA